jgi:protein SCO1/2
MKMRAALLLVAVVLAGPLASRAHDDVPAQRLPTIGPAPDFALTSQDGAPVALRDLRGKIVAVTFIYTACADACPLLTEKMAQVQDALGADFGARIAFVSISVDPWRDTPAVLKQYAENHGAHLTGWSFLTGEPAAIRDVTRRYGVFAASAPGEDVEHTFLTSLIDARGYLRVQYVGAQFDPNEFLRDLLSLVPTH